MAVFLSGPSFAIEVIQHQPTCVTVASSDPKRAKWAQRTFHSKIFRVYTASDVIGVELAGSIKNVIAIASGIASGLGYQMNPRAALLTRGISEMGRLSVKMGGDPITLLTLAGIGDLFLTCTSEKSRNFTVGFRLGKGEKLDDIISSLGSVAEGVPTTRAAHDLAAKLDIFLPIIEAVYKVLYENLDVKQALEELLELASADELVFQQ
jgi:glycerol-3-phosphate dehydrogenase (NAD(P)+)